MEATLNQNNGMLHAPRDAVDRVFWSALTVFSERGYEGASIREIVERAKVTRPVLYYYFKSKEELFSRLLEFVTEQGVQQRARALCGVTGCRNKLKALIWTEFERAEQAPEVVRFVLQAFFSAPQEGPQLDKDRLWRDRFRQILAVIQEGQQTGELGPGDARALALAFSGMMDMHIMGKSHQPQARLTREFGEALVDLFLDGARATSSARQALRTPFAFEELETGSAESLLARTTRHDGEGS